MTGVLNKRFIFTHARLFGDSLHDTYEPDEGAK
jgi:hypothetical protein